MGQQKLRGGDFITSRAGFAQTNIAQAGYA
jgi:hypothetical protein